ncbi:MAG TPA: TIGR03067 domain-containing protein [Bryobacteraceae bacterium]
MHKDLESLQGSWVITALKMDGQGMPAEMLAEARVVIEGNRFQSFGMGDVYGGTVKIDASVSPRRIDLKFDSGPEKGNTNLGIYELDGDTWKLCLATRGSTRPAKFQSKPGSGIAVETLRRASAEAKPRTSKKVEKTAPVSSGPATEFEGDWQMVSGVMDGVAMKESDIQWVKRLTRGNQTTVQAGPQVMMKFEFSRDPAPSPKTIEYVNTAGPNKGKKQQGIYEIEGGVLRVCVAAPGASRPASFQGVRGTTLTVWRKI